MSLTDAQIDRYSRQIIVPHVGGVGQERLLAARILLAGDARDIEAPFAYLVGAGVGTVIVNAAGVIDSIAAMHDLNPDVTVTDELKAPTDLALLIVGSEEARKIAEEIVKDSHVRGLVIARLDDPGKIVVIPDARSARIVEARFGKRSEAADFVAMLATAEAFKLIAGYAENPTRATIDFDGYETKVRVNP